MRLRGSIVVFYAGIALFGGQFVFAQDLENIQKAIDSRNYTTAIENARLGMVENSGNPEYVLLLVRSLNLAKMHDELISEFDNNFERLKDTDIAGKILLEKAKSLQNNKKNLSEAASLYNEIISSYPNDDFAVSAAYYQLASMDLAAKLPEKASVSFSKIISDFPESPFVDDAYLGLVKCGAALLNKSAIDGNIAALEQKFPSSPLLTNAYLVQADFNNQTAGDKAAAFQAYSKIIERNDPGIGIQIARIRIADMALRGTFQKSIEEYERILADYPELSKHLKEWVHCQMGLFYWQLDDKEAARRHFLLAQETNPANKNVQKDCRTHLNAFDNPESVDMILALFDRGIRWRQAGTSLDKCYKDFYDIKDLADKRSFEQYVADTSISNEDRAQMRYRMTLVEFMIGNHDNIPGLLEKVDELQPQGITRQMALYMQAYYHVHCGKGENSLEIMKKVVDERPNHNYLIPQAYRFLVSHYAISQDPFEAVLLSEEFKILYPYRKECEYFDIIQKRLFRKDNSLQARLEKDKANLAARLKSKFTDIPIKVTDASGIINESVKITALAGEVK